MEVEYQQLEDALEAVGAEVGAAEAQGLLCGMAGVGGTPDKAAWIAQVLAETRPRGEAAKTCLALLVALYDRTMRALDDDAMAFQALLPDDSAPLSERVRSLGRWASGFLVGMGIGGLTKDAKLPDDVREALRDLDAIAQVGAEAAGEEDENAYAELVEYVKVAALLVRAELRPPPVPTAPKDSPDKRLH